MTKRIIYSSLITFIFFVFSIQFLTEKVKDSKVLLEIDITIKKDDLFQIFYKHAGENHFTEKNSIKKKIEGKSKKQKIEFHLSTDKPIKEIRIDIGENSKQELLEIKNINFKTISKSKKLNIKDSFKPNEFIQFNKDKFIETKTVNNRYDPYFISNFDIEDLFKDIRKEKLMYRKVIIYNIIFFIIVTLLLTLVGNTKIKSLNSSIFIISIFVLILTSPLIVKTLGINLKGLNEKRKATEKPKFEFSDSFSKNYEKYYNDNFGLRPLLINWGSKLKTHYFKTSTKPELVLFGKDGYLFYNKKGHEIYESYSNTNTVEEKKLNTALNNQINLKRKLKEKGIQYVVGYFPNKHTIYNEKLPLSMKKQIKDSISLADQVSSYFSDNEFPFVDVKENLLAKKNTLQLYHKFDTHWNAYGAYLAYKSICEQTFDELGIEYFDESYFEISYKKTKNGDLTDILGIKGIESYSDEAPKFILKNNKMNFHFLTRHNFPKNYVITLNKNCGNKKVVVIYRDSFTSALIQFLSLHFHKVIYIKSRDVDFKLLDEVNADIVMSFSIERLLVEHLFQ